MKKLLKYLRNSKKEVILGPLFKLLEAIFELIVPLVVASIIDNGINGTGGVNHIILMICIMVVLGLVGLVCSITAQYFSAKAATTFSKEVRQNLFEKMQSLSYAEIDKMGTSSMITQITSDVNQVQNGVNLFLRLFLRSPFVVFGALIMAMIVNVKAGLVFLAIIPILLVIVFAILLITKKKFKNVQDNLDDVVKQTRENLQGARVIRAFHNEEDEYVEYTESLNNLANKQKRVSILSTLLNPLTYVIINLGIILVVYIGAKEVEGGILLQGDVLALYNYMGQILVELIKFANLVITLSKALASASRIAKTFELESSLVFTKHNEGDIQSDAFIEFKNVSFKYNNASGYAIENVSFKVNKGDTIGIIGGTGSGKTSLVNLLPHFYDPTDGEIYYKGKNVNSYDLPELRESIGVVPQKAVLFKGTIASNLKWRNKDASDAEMYDALETAQALDIIKSKTDGLNSIVEQNGQNFSGGQKQRLSIARALINSPEVLILDDSASALDYLTDSRLRKAISNMKNAPTTFIVSQRTSSIANADKIIVLDNGKVVGVGKHDELLKSSPVYLEIYNSQFKKGDE